MQKINTKKKPLDYLVILPIYNETLTLNKSLTLINNYLKTQWGGKSWKIVVVDNNSTDSPDKIVSDFSSNIEFIKIDKKGRGYAIKKASKSFDSKIYICLDIDIPLKMSDIQKLIEPVQQNKASVSIGRRTGKRPIGRMILTKVLYFINLLFLDLNIHDSQCGAIAYSKSVVKTINKCKQNGYFLHTELLKRVRHQGDSIIEAPINWVESRFKRKSKVSLVKDPIMGFKAIFEICQNFYPKLWPNSIALISICLLIISAYFFAMHTFSKTGFYTAKYIDSYYPYLLFFAVTIGLLYILFGTFLKKSLKTLPKGLVIFILVITFSAISIIAVQTLPYRSQDIYHDLVIVKGGYDYGLNPYLTTPNDLGTESWTKYLVNWKNLQMTYGPIWVFILTAVLNISTSLIQILIMIKILFLIVLIACGYLLNKIMNLLGIIKEKKIWLMGIFLFNPLVIQYFLIDLHIDIFICLSILLSYYFFLKKNYIASIFSLLGGGLIKYISLILIPIPLMKIILGEKRNKIKILLIIGTVSCIIFFAAYLPFGLTPKLFQGIENELTQRASAYESSFGSLILLQLTRNITAVKMIGLVLAVVSTFFYIKSNSPLRYILPFIIIFCIGAPWFMPHYLLWIIPLSFIFFPWWIIAICTIIIYLLGPSLILPTPYATSLIYLIAFGYILYKKIHKILF
jgi:hypothetical protein